MATKELLLHRVTMLFVGIAMIAGLPHQARWPALDGSTASATEMSHSEAVRKALPMSVRIQVYSGDELRRSATGVVVRSESEKVGAPAHSVILTNAHVADPAELSNVSYRVLLERHGRVVQTLTAKLLALGHVPELDLALLQVDASLPAAELATEDSVEVGSDVVVVGAPYGKSLSVSGGMISQLEADARDAKAPLRYKAMKTDAAIGYGSSGGGVFDVATGHLVGIVEGYRTARVAINDQMSFDIPMPGETFLAPMSKIRNFIADHLDATNLTATRALEPAAPAAVSKTEPTAVSVAH